MEKRKGMGLWDLGQKVQAAQGFREASLENTLPGVRLFILQLGSSPRKHPLPAP